MGLHPTLGHDDPLCQFTKLRVVEKSHLNVVRNDSPLLHELGAVPSQLQDLGDKVLQGGGHDHRRLNPWEHIGLS